MFYQRVKKYNRDTMIHLYFKTVKDRKFKKIDQVRAGCWINVENATIEDLQELTTLTGLDIHHLQDSLDNFEIPRIERQKEGVLIYVRTPSMDPAGIYTELLTIILTDKYLITISRGKNKIIQYILDQRTSVATTQKTKLLIQMLLRLAHEYTVQTKKLRTTFFQSAHDFTNIDTRDFIELAKSQEVLDQYITALVPMKNVLEVIQTGKYVNLYADDEELVQDLLIAIRQSTDIASVNLRSIRYVRESYQVIFTNDLNKIIKLFTSLTVILTIPTIVASYFGMNVDVPFDLYPFAFPAIVAGSLLLCLAVIIFLYYKKWL